MKSKRLLAASIACAVAAIPLSAVAADTDMPDTYFYGGLSVSEYYHDFTSKGGDLEVPRLTETTLPGVQMGWRYAPNWSVDLSFARHRYGTKKESKGPQHLGNSGYMNNYLIQSRYHYNDTHILGFEPYTGLAAGEVRFTPSNDTDKHHRETVVGPVLGAQTMLLPYMSFELGAMPLWQTRTHQWDGKIFAGLNFVFDTTKAEAAPAPAPAPAPVDGDADGDGVADSIDQCPNTPAGAVVDETGCQKMLTQDVKATLRVGFGFDDATVPQSDYENIGKVADFAKKYPASNVTLDGYTDTSGPAAYNKSLSQDRADAVKAVLVDSFGVDGDRISAEGHGEANPVASNDTREGRSQNRRVEAAIKAVKEKPQFNN